MTMTHTFRGRTLTEAKGAAEAALGPDVVVLERRKVKQKGLSGLFGATEFEIEVGMPVTAPMIESALEERRPARGYESAPSSRPLPSLQFARAVYEEDDEQPDPQRTRASAGDIARLENEVRAVRAMLYRMSGSPDKLVSQLQSLRRAVDDIAPRGSTPERVERLVEKSGVTGAPARVLLARLRRHEGDDDSLIDAYRDALADLIKVRPWPLSGDDKRLIALVGPPGVGKTTTLAKIAANAIENNQTVRFITCDTYRVGAVEQLTSYADLLGCGCDVARSQRELHKAIRAADADIVLVDTAGRGPEGEQSVEAGLGEGRRGARTGWEERTRHVLLCLEASIRFADVSELCERYAACSPTALAITKLDLTNAPGGLIHGTTSTLLPITLLCTGQRVPEDIAPATAGRILDYLAPRHRLSN
jgi:flagellar biosynthesis protein FlhF